MLKPTTTPAPLRFDDLSGNTFERLVFAYLIRTEPAYEFEWYGQAGKDRGRDIIGKGRIQENQRRLLLVACANWHDFTVAKAKSDLDSCVASPMGAPEEVRFITGSRKITASMRDDVKAYCRSQKVYECGIWSGPEFEENLRARSESLLRRIFEGEIFPDGVEELVQFSRQTPAANDREILELLSRALDRPAFKDRIWQESSLPAFRQAIEDAICVINTGVWKTREGILIAQLPSKHEIQNARVRTVLETVVDNLRSLRTFFDDALRSGDIRSCNCHQPDCPTYFMENGIAVSLEQTRSRALESFQKSLMLSTTVQSGQFDR